MSIGGAGNDRITGTNFANILRGEDGKDNLKGLSGDDNLFGDGGNDKLSGGKGDDNLFGGEGRDVLKGDKGIDSLWGNGGKDTFKVTKGDGYDIIEDFTDGEDRISLGSIALDVNLVEFGQDLLVIQQSDLLALVKDGAGKLQLEGRFLV